MSSRLPEHLGLLGSFSHVDSLTRAVNAAQQAEAQIIDVFSPVPIPKIVEIVTPRPSPVRFATLLGGLLGMVGGLALGVLTAMIWNIVVGGKPVTNHVPFVVVAFEGMILLGALGTFLGLLVSARLPFRKFPGPAYRPEFSFDRFGLFVACEASRAEMMEELLKREGAISVESLKLTSNGRDSR